MAEVLPFTGDTTLDIPVETVCENARDWDEVLIIGTDKDGKPCYASSTGDKYKLLWLAQRFAAKLLWGDFT